MRSSLSPPDPIDIAVGEKIRTLRREQKKSQSALGDALGMSFQQIQKYERGTNRVSASVLVKIAEFLGVAVSNLLPVVSGPQATDNHRHKNDMEAQEIVEAYFALSEQNRRAVLRYMRLLKQQSNL